MSMHPERMPPVLPRLIIKTFEPPRPASLQKHHGSTVKNRQACAGFAGIVQQRRRQQIGVTVASMEQGQGNVKSVSLILGWQ